MIEVFTGKLGGGKSYHAAMRIANQLGIGGTVASNMELHFDGLASYCLAVHGVHIEERQLIRIPDEIESVEVVSSSGKRSIVDVSTVYRFHSFVPAGTADCPVLVVIDEAHLFFNSRDYAKTDQLGRGMLSYLTQSRKVGNDLILITQDWRNLDSQFVRLLQFLWKFRDMSRFKIPPLGIAWPCSWPLVGWLFPDLLAVQLDQDGKTQLHRVWSNKDKRVFKCYETADLLRPIAGRNLISVGRIELKKKKSVALAVWVNF